MKNNTIIIHISDLHIYRKSLYEEKYDLDFHFHTETEDNDIDSFNSQLKKLIDTFDSKNIFLVITGDISNSGEEDEFEKAEEFLEDLFQKLQIDKNKVLIVPGDHDINRSLLKKELENSKTSKKAPNLFIKYSYYNDFYNSLLDKECDCKSQILNIINIEDYQISLIGLNSNQKIGINAGEGYINCIELRKELISNKEIFLENKIFVFHHNLFSNYKEENKVTGQWSVGEYGKFIELINDFEIKLCLLGNEHTNGTNEVNNLYISDSGSLLSIKKPQATFKIYKLNENKDKIYFENNLFSLIKNSSTISDEFGTWSPSGLQNMRNEKPEIVIQVKSKAGGKLYDIPGKEIPEEKIEHNDSKKLDEEKTTTEKNNHVSTTSEIELENDKRKIQLKLELEELNLEFKQIVKKENLFITGHFHWSESSRAHNWIDIAKMLQSNETLNKARKVILNIIEVYNLHEKVTHLIALGQEGNLLASPAMIKYEFNFSFLPYSYRYSEHNDFEKVLKIDNIDKINEVMIIADVVHDGRSVANLVNSIEDNFFRNAKKIHLVSLFFTGENKQSVENFIDSNRCKFYYITQLKVESCPYSDSEYENKCTLIKEGFKCIHYFYNHLEKTETKNE